MGGGHKIKNQLNKMIAFLKCISKQSVPYEVSFVCGSKSHGTKSSIRFVFVFEVYGLQLFKPINFQTGTDELIEIIENRAV